MGAMAASAVPAAQVQTLTLVAIKQHDLMT